ncbi:MAG TPA: hypothetical protein VF068_08745, partial [Rubrobacter sp.]
SLERGAAAVVVGSASKVSPELPGSLDRAALAPAVAWSVLFVAVAEWEAGNTSELYRRGKQELAHVCSGEGH